MSCFYSEPGYNCEGICIDELACNFGLNQTECVFVEPGYNCYGNEVIVQLGDSAFGGIVFYIDSTGQHGLVSALNDTHNCWSFTNKFSNISFAVNLPYVYLAQRSAYFSISGQTSAICSFGTIVVLFKLACTLVTLSLSLVFHYLF